MITVREAKRIAKDWVEAEAPNIPHFRGAFLMDRSSGKTMTNYNLRLLMWM